MDWLEAGISLTWIVVVGFLGLMVLLFVLALLFGQRRSKRWEYEAEFFGESGREIGELEIELSKIHKVDEDFVQRVKLQLMHPSLQPGGSVEGWIEGACVLRADVEHPGRILVRDAAPLEPISEPSSGQTASVRVDGVERASGVLKRD